jgi:hypothetical protein
VVSLRSELLSASTNIKMQRFHLATAPACVHIKAVEV